jgi:PKD repeat protein
MISNGVNCSPARLTKAMAGKPASMIILVLVAMLSCSKLPKPDFTYFPVENPESGDTIWFINASKNADAYQWDFGDGGVSSEMDPAYVYSEAGIFEVQLNAVNEAGTETESQSITIYEPTILEFIVYDSSQTARLAGTTVWVYDNAADRDSLYTPLYSGIADTAGTVSFRNVEPLVYHVWVSLKVSGGAWTFRGFTNPLKQNKVNNYIVPCTWSYDQEGMTW